MKIQNLVEKLNSECANKKKDFFNKWTERDIDMNPDEEFWHRTYCYNAYSTFELCDNCSRTLEKENTKFNFNPDGLQKNIEKLNERIVQLEEKIEILTKVVENLQVKSESHCGVVVTHP
jgi:hypothetical protein